MPNPKRIPPDPNVSNRALAEQLSSYAKDAPRHSWSRQWMGIAARRIQNEMQEAPLMKMGMSRTEAKARVAEGEYTWEDLRRRLEITHPTLEGDAGRMRSRVNKTLSLSISFNIHWRATRGRTGPITSTGDQLSARNLLRDFGNSKATRQRKPDPPVHHQELINIHDDDPDGRQ